MCPGENKYSDGTYLERNSSWHIEDSPWKASHIEKSIRKHALSVDRVADVGCGAGEVLRVLAKDFPNGRFFGFEMSPQASKFHSERESDRVEFLQEDFLAGNSTFSLVLCIDVVEHVEDSYSFLRELRRRGDAHIFHIPLELSALSVLQDAPRRAREQVGHLHFYTPSTARLIIEECGYQILESRFTPFFYGLPVSSWKAKIAWIPRRILFWISPEWCVRVLGGCSLLVVARPVERST
jgi:SAM-dependent methyltransferase